MEVPFYYQLSFSLFAYNNQDDLKQQQITREFKNSNPILARNQAFEEFEEIMNWLKDLKRVQKTHDNFILIQPEIITGPINELNKKYDSLSKDSKKLKDSIVVLADLIEAYDKYSEELRIDIVLENEAQEVANENETQLTIHKVASRKYDPDDLLCGGLLVEIALYKHYKFDYQNKKIHLVYRGTDYYDSGEDEDAAQYEILETPRGWISEDREEVTEESSELSHTDIIKRGEGKYIEFKPALLYNFKTGKSGFSIKYIIAKAIAAFLNSDGGILYIGVKDNGEIQGLEKDYSVLQGENKRDKLKLEFDRLIRNFFPAFVSTYITTSIIQIQEKDIYAIRIYSSQKPVILRNSYGDTLIKEFYYRQEASSIKIEDVEELIDYVFNHKNYRDD